MNRQNLYNGDSYMGERRSVEEVIKALELCRYDPDPGQEPKYSHSCMKCPYGLPDRRCAEMFADAIKLLEARRWIPFRVRPLTEEEKELHPDWDQMYDCPLPEDGEEILITFNPRGRPSVQQDCWSDVGDTCGLDSGWDIPDEAVAWMPMPEPYKEAKEHD